MMTDQSSSLHFLSLMADTDKTDTKLCSPPSSLTANLSPDPSQCLISLPQCRHPVAAPCITCVTLSGLTRCVSPRPEFPQTPHIAPASAKLHLQ